MRKIKPALAFLLCVLMFISCVPSVYADNFGTRTVIGADLTSEQVDMVYNMFGITRGSTYEMTVTNAEERLYLSSFIESSVIGTRAISCVYLQLMPEGSGIEVNCINVNWCTPEIYRSALITAGVTDIKVIVAAPFEVSGTAALTGIYKAYEDITGSKIDEEVKLASNQELTVTSELAEEIGEADSMAIVNELKLILDETKKMSDEELRSEIISIAASYHVALNDNEINKLISLCRSLENLDVDALTQRVDDIKNTITKVAEAKDKVVSFAQRVSDFFRAVGDFIDKVKAVFNK